MKAATYSSKVVQSNEVLLRIVTTPVLVLASFLALFSLASLALSVVIGPAKGTAIFLGFMNLKHSGLPEGIRLVGATFNWLSLPIAALFALRKGFNR